MPTTSISLRIDNDLLEYLKVRAEAEHRSLSNMIISILLKERENYVSIPFNWLVKFCTHMDFREPMSDKERAERWKEKLSQQFGVKFDGMKVKWDS